MLAFERVIRLTVEHEPSLIGKMSEQLGALLAEGLSTEDSIIQIRYFELACKLALINPELSKVVEPVIQRVFD